MFDFITSSFTFENDIWTLCMDRKYTVEKTISIEVDFTFRVGLIDIS